MLLVMIRRFLFNVIYNIIEFVYFTHVCKHSMSFKLHSKFNFIRLINFVICRFNILLLLPPLDSSQNRDCEYYVLTHMRMFVCYEDMESVIE